MEFLLLAMIEQIFLRQQDNLRKNVKQVFRHFTADVVELWSLREKKAPDELRLLSCQGCCLGVVSKVQGIEETPQKQCLKAWEMEMGVQGSPGN